METTATTRTASSRLHAGMQAVARARIARRRPMPLRSAALEVAEIVRTLDADDDVVIAAMIQPLLDGQVIEREGAEKRFGEEPLRLARALSQLGQFGLPADWTPDRGLESGTSRSPAQNAAGGHRRCAAGRGAARRATAENALGQALGRGPAAQARGGNPRGVCASGQSAGRVAGQMGTGRPGVSLSGTAAVQAYCHRAQSAPLGARALHR